MLVLSHGRLQRIQSLHQWRIADPEERVSVAQFSRDHARYLAVASYLLLQGSWTKAYNAMWRVFSTNHTKGPAIAVVESLCPEILDKDFLTHCEQLLSTLKV